LRNFTLLGLWGWRVCCCHHLLREHRLFWFTIQNFFVCIFKIFFSVLLLNFIVDVDFNLFCFLHWVTLLFQSYELFKWNHFLFLNISNGFYW
jgi:hypothetical protein